MNHSSIIDFLTSHEQQQANQESVESKQSDDHETELEEIEILRDELRLKNDRIDELE